ncbi:hypothetical protein D3C81_1185280 [compost metagenome]
MGDRSLTRLVVDQLQIFDQLTGVVGGILHGDHSSRLLTGVVLDHGLIHLRFDIANQQGIQQLLGVGFVQVIPQALLRAVVGLGSGSQGEQLFNRRLLGHGVHELVGRQVQAIQRSFVEPIQHDLDAADQIVDRRRITQVADRSDHVAAVAAEEAGALAADDAELCLNASIVPVLHVFDQGLEQVDVQATAETTVTGYQDVADTLDRTLHHEGMAVFRVGLGQVTDHLTDTHRVRTACSHALLSPAHLADRHFFHGVGDLLRALDARNLAANLFCACHVTPFGLAGGSLAAPAAAYQL